MVTVSFQIPFNFTLQVEPVNIRHSGSRRLTLADEVCATFVGLLLIAIVFGILHNMTPEFRIRKEVGSLHIRPCPATI